MGVAMNCIRLTFIIVFFVIGTLLVPDLARASEDCPQPRNTLKAPKNIYNKKNPLRNTRKNISAGEELFFQVRKELGCVRCHGVLGNGKGDMAKGLEPPPRNFSCTPMMNKIPDGQLFWVIKNGSANTGMYTYSKLKDKDVWQLILFIRQFSKK
jgi:cytochrome c